MALGSQQKIGSYRLLNIVMTGQTSQVWEVMNDSQGKRYAMKVLLTDYRRDREHLAYLKNEFEVGSKLKHPKVIEIFEMGAAGGHPFVIMEFFPWPNLKQYIRQGVDRLGWLATRVIDQSAEALAYMNEQGWVHRDIKPDNYLMTDQGDIRLIDFALALRPKKGFMRLLAGKTKIQGTRSYMSPEQIRGLPLDQRADVYSYACMVHELLGGKPPFTGVSANELLTKHLKQPAPPVAAANNNVTPEFSALLKRMLAKNPDSRPESMSKFLQEFRAIRVFKVAPKPPVETTDE